MQLQDFAKQVLFGATLEEKLSYPREEIIDTDPGPAMATPQRLTRPPHLALRDDGSKASHPRPAKLIDERERGRLLHFFGNHELLATELMALALLKFPDAPKSFRQGLLDTLKDEQIHTRIYIHRMRQCGVEFGELPLSDYFWKSVSSMEDPLDYVTRLSLTFEQANLDYAREYGALFRQVGDEATAGILDKIYRDEIGHVGFGLQWFRRWKANGKSDWEAYRERLVFPLSPARAKGNLFNADGRSAAGFDEAFIKDLRIFSQSRGRTPSLHWFNPEAERFAAQNAADGFTPTESALHCDLAFLPAYLAKRDDVVLLPKLPSPEFLERIQNYGFALPELVVVGNEGVAPALGRKLGSLRPWAWSPDSVRFFGNAFSELTRPIGPDTLWNEGIRQLYDKSWAADFGRALVAANADNDWIAPAEVYGQSISSFAELTEWRRRFAEMGYANVVIKAPFATAANGIRCLMTDESISPTVHAWLESIWNQQGKALVEPWLNRVFDFSVQFERRDAELRLIAFTRLVNNARGQFRGIVTNAFAAGLPPELLRFLLPRINGEPRLYSWYQRAFQPLLEARLNGSSFIGPLGIDAFVYRDPLGELKLKPIVELNPRVTMGRIAHELSFHNGPRSAGYFQILTKSQLKANGGGSFSTRAAALSAENPPLLTDERPPRIVSGTFALTDPDSAQRFLALYHVRSRFDQLPLD